MATQPRIVIIGAGILGCALADELTRRGRAHVTVLDEGPLPATGASTRHAPGMLFRATGDRTMTRLADATAATYARTTLNGSGAFRPVGGLELATTPERLTDLHRRHGRAAASGTGSRIVDASECATLHPLIDPSTILGGLYVPGDGLVSPVVAARAQAGAATSRGATFLGHRRVTGIERSGGRVRSVHTSAGERFEADMVVSCAGTRGLLVGALAGLTIPLVPVVHRYVITSPVAALDAVHALESLTGRADPSLPILRHRDADLDVCEHGDRIGIGAFVTEDVGPSWDAALALLPGLADATCEEEIESALPFSPDGLPLLGEHPDLAGFWSAEAVRSTHAAGVAEAMAEWMTTGRPAVGGEPIDLSCAHLDRFDPRPVGPGAFGSRQVELRAVFGDAAGGQRPLWFEANAALPEVCETPRRRGRAARNWSPVTGAEALLTRRAAGLFDLSRWRRVEVTGPGAREFLERLTTSRIDRPVGTVLSTLMLDEAAGVRADLTVTRLGPQRFELGMTSRLDVGLLRSHTMPGVTIRDVTDETCALGLWGPKVPEILDGLVPGGAQHLGPSEAAEFSVGPVPVTGLRTSRVGEYGWEFSAAAEHGEALWDTLFVAGARHGLVAAGWHAFSSLRMETGHCLRGADISAEHDPDACGLGSAVDMDKGPFVGRAALARRRLAGPPARSLVTLVLDHPQAVLLGQEPVYDVPAARRSRGPVLVDSDSGVPAPAGGDGGVLGHVASAAVGHTVGESIAHVWLPTERAVTGTRVEVECLGLRLGAEVVDGPRHAPADGTGASLIHPTATS
ncbi:FAD-dependent oxidoreductase [Pseudonocardia sp. KRD291]|uniref:FAD-dependent oxidoreductase n=1 Tax=Pseudonocardia sp. KRD291 TaxID=2792007 RepID=UPI001C4A6C69|nr:FAD-dependent oxidoreductase [Pseudonocardia sp. KRD291]MBW0104760.1 GcvT family protein [Pseudonocardia sp. KRD291]